MNDERGHHLITVRELREQLSRIPEDSHLAFTAGATVLQFLGIMPDTRPGLDGVFAVNLRQIHNYPPVSP